MGYSSCFLVRKLQLHTLGNHSIALPRRLTLLPSPSSTELLRAKGEVFNGRGLSVKLGSVNHPKPVKTWEVDWSLVQDKKACGLFQAQNRKKLSFSLQVLAPCTHVFSLHSHVALANSTHRLQWEPEYHSTAMECS